MLYSKSEDGGRHYPTLSDEAEIGLPPDSDGEGLDGFSDEVIVAMPSPSDIQGDGRRLAADMATAKAPSPEGEMGQTGLADEVVAPLPISPLIDRLAEQQVRRKFCIGLVNKQTNAAKALVRRSLGWRYDDKEAGEKINARAARIVAAAVNGKEVKAEDVDIFNSLLGILTVVSSAIEPIQKERDRCELDMKRTVRKLPVYEWAKAVRGLGELGLAVIVAEAGDIAKYPKKGHLWKRLGLAAHEGKAYSTWRREGGLSAEDWVAAGYSPRRRAEVYAVISEPLFRQQSVVSGPYRAIYDRRRARTAEAHPDWTKGHSHADGLRVMTKYLLRDLWQEWRRVDIDVSSEAIEHMPAAEPNRSEAICREPQPAASSTQSSSDPLANA